MNLMVLDYIKDFTTAICNCHGGGVDTINGDGSRELAVTRRVRLGWNAFNNLSIMLCGNRYTWKIKGTVHV